jgi:4'-phosphopantetheinyl transferase
METFDFSIAHSAGIVLCAGNTLGQIGADIERVSSRDLADYQDQLTAAEWQYIHQAPDHLMAFYDIWTRKEALMKAIGRGIDMDFDTLDVCGDTATYESKVYAFYPLFISAGYVAHLASSIPLDSESISLEALPFEPI